MYLVILLLLNLSYADTAYILQLTDLTDFISVSILLLCLIYLIYLSTAIG
jgi:hypothetical protein